MARSDRSPESLKKASIPSSKVTSSSFSSFLPLPVSFSAYFVFSAFPALSAAETEDAPAVSAAETGINDVPAATNTAASPRANDPTIFFRVDDTVSKLPPPFYPRPFRPGVSVFSMTIIEAQIIQPLPCFNTPPLNLFLHYTKASLIENKFLSMSPGKLSSIQSCISCHNNTKKSGVHILYTPTNDMSTCKIWPHIVIFL